MRLALTSGYSFGTVLAYSSKSVCDVIVSLSFLPIYVDKTSNFGPHVCFCAVNSVLAAYPISAWCFAKFRLVQQRMKDNLKPSMGSWTVVSHDALFRFLLLWANFGDVIEESTIRLHLNRNSTFHEL